MPSISPFAAIRPREDLAARIAALPYDVYNRREAAEEIAKEPLSFLRVDRAETAFPDDINTYDDQVYLKAKELLDEMMADGTYITEDRACYYIYELTMGPHVQAGLVACSSIADYQANIIKQHEQTRPEKLHDRLNHIDVTNAHTGLIFMSYRSLPSVNLIIARQQLQAPLYDFIAADGVRHRVWIINDQNDIHELNTALATIPATYIADGHHRTASAVGVGLRRRAENPHHTGQEGYNRFLSVLFPDDQLQIMSYNRIIADLNGYSHDDFLAAVENHGFLVKRIGEKAVSPRKKGEFGMYLRGVWYQLTAQAQIISSDPVTGLDVALLQEHLLNPILGIDDARVNGRIEFVGGIRGLTILEEKTAAKDSLPDDMAVAFSLHPTSMEELLRVADAGFLMPPKSTWFEPKLRSGLFIHSLD
ncbi:MAG: DUF1015 family protein [Lachnospiraceae bacterium]|jgi:uncharacterized protein (DUF1015 family)|nr:DUF1015 family protein [Lachnospiraceae bacterium]